MGATLDGVDIVDVGVEVLRVVGVVHDGHLDGYALPLGLQIDDVVEEVLAVPVDIAHEFLQSVLGVEHFLACLARIGVGTQVGQCDADAGVEVGQLAHAACDDVPLECGGGEYGGVGPELLACASLGGLADYLDGVEGFAFLVLLLVYMPVAIDLREHVGGEGIDAAHAYAVKSA